MGAFPFLDDLAPGAGIALSTPEGQSVRGTGKAMSAIVSAAQNDFVYQPGGAAHDNVFSSWPLLIAAVNAVAGMRRILVDPTFAGDTGPTVPAGTWSVDNVQFFGASQSAGFLPVLTFLDGAHLTGVSIYVQNLILQSSSTTPVMTFAGGVGCDITVAVGAVFGSASAPFFLAATDSGSVNLIFLNESSVGDGSNPAIEANGSANISIAILNGSTLFANATSGTAPTIPVLFIQGAEASFAAEFPTLADANVQFPQAAGLAPDTLAAQLPFPLVQQFLVNQIGVGTIAGSGAVQTSNATPADVPGTQFGDATVPMPNHTGGQVELKVIARIPSTDQTVSWHAEAAFKRVGATITAGTLKNVGGNALASFAPSAGDATALAGTTIGLDVGANGITPQVTGLVGVTIDWTVEKVSYSYTHA